MQPKGLWRAFAVLIGATVASGVATIIIADPDRLLSNATFAVAAIALGVLWIPPRTQPGTLAVAAVGYTAASLVVGVFSLFFIEGSPDLSAILAFPLDALGDYPPGADVPLFVGLAFWLPSTIGLYGLSLAMALAIIKGIALLQRRRHRSGV
jgi:hypothetical protein